MRLKVAPEMPIQTLTKPLLLGTHLTMPVDPLLKSLSHLIYASSADSTMGDAELRDILERARTVNSRLAITGILLHTEGSYFQVLEGEAEAIDSLYAKISHDKRHTNVVLIVREPIASRVFADWSMGFAQVTSKDVAGIIGANDFFGKNTCFQELSAGRAKKLLAAFADGRWRASSAA
jgi:Sensors of blue-light using FAD